MKQCKCGCGTVKLDVAPRRGAWIETYEECED